MRALLLQSLDGATPTRLAVLHDRTLGAPWLPGDAHGRPQLHHRLIELPRRLAVPGHDAGRNIPDAPRRCPAVPRSAFPVLNSPYAPDHTRDVRVDRRDRLLVREARHGAGGVAA